jgi:TP901 family phage tail tape measure protein
MSALTIPSIFTAIDKFTGPVKGMGNAVDQFNTKSERLERRFRSISETSKKVAVTSGAIGLAILAPLALATREAVGFEKSMSNISTIVDTNKESMDQMGANVLKVASIIPKPIEELTSSLYDIRSAGILASNAITTLESSGRLAVTGLGTTSEATNIMTSAMNAFKNEGKSADEIANILFKTVKSGKTTIAELSQAFGANASIIESAGIGLADFQAATAALTTTGLPAAQAQNKIRSSIVNLLKPTAEMEKVFTSLGVTTGQELIKKYGTLGATYKAIEGQSKKLNLGLANVLGSSEALSAVTSINSATNEAYIATLADMESGTNSMNEAFEKQMKTGAAQAQLMENNIKAITITIGTQLIPIMNDLIKVIVPIIQGFMDWTKNNKGAFKAIILIVAAVGALAMAVSVVSLAVSVFTGLTAAWGAITAIATAATWAWGAALSIGLWPLTLIALGIAATIALITVIINKWDEWGAALTLFMGPLGFIISLIQSFRRNWDMIGDAFKNGGILAGFKAIGATILDAILMPLQQVFELMSNIPGLGDFASKAVSGIEGFRAKLGVETGEKGSQTDTPAVNPEVARQESLQRTISEQRQNVAIDINDKTGRASVDSGNNMIPVKLTSTFGF